MRESQLQPTADCTHCVSPTSEPGRQPRSQHGHAARRCRRRTAHWPSSGSSGCQRPLTPGSSPRASAQSCGHKGMGEGDWSQHLGSRPRLTRTPPRQLPLAPICTVPPATKSHAKPPWAPTHTGSVSPLRSDTRLGLQCVRERGAEVLSVGTYSARCGLDKTGRDEIGRDRALSHGQMRPGETRDSRKTRTHARTRTAY